MNAVWEKARRAEGWLEYLEAAILFAMCEGPWCEVGAWKGRSSIVLAETGYPGFVVDTFAGSPEHGDVDTFEEFAANTAGYRNLTVLRGDLADMASRVPMVQLLYLDADHSYDETKRAYDAYAAKVIENGFLVFHDACGGGWPEVERFVDELDPNVWRRLVTVQRVVAFQKT